MKDKKKVFVVLYKSYDGSDFDICVAFSCSERTENIQTCCHNCK